MNHNHESANLQFKADRLQMIVVAKKLSVLQLFISRMPKMCAILQLVSAPLNPIPIAEHFRRSHPQCDLLGRGHSLAGQIYFKIFDLVSKVYVAFLHISIIISLLINSNAL